ncbi:hypothetical protein [Actinoplanes lobatus]|nr:hypothetical protein [Actinoplanes lobatus]MBB4754133.1 hypothetical protein [Actinoplanes lobatus]
MTDKRSVGSLLHWAAHRIPGVPAHAERLAGHQGTAIRGRAHRGGDVARPSLNNRWNHTPARPPRFLAVVQRRVAAFFGREL